MTKPKNPLFGFNVRGTLANAITFRRHGQETIAEEKPIPKDAKTSAQLAWRTMYQLCTGLWNALSAAEKATWESLARRQHMTGYAWFMSQALKPNPGIYLPLAGGTMQGSIAMSGNTITGLSAPTANDEPTRKVDQTWTVNKLRKGAGIGTPPTEIGIGTGANEVAAGNHTHTLVDDITGTAVSVLTATGTALRYFNNTAIAINTELTLVSKTLAFAALSRAVAVGFGVFSALNTNSLKTRLYMNGVQIAESSYIASHVVGGSVVALTGTRSLSGSCICKFTCYAYSASTLYTVAPASTSGWPVGSGIGIGSIKI